MEDGPLPDLRDIELKLGRKVPESLVRSLRGEEPVPPERDRDPGGGSGGGGSGCSSSSSCCSFPLSLSSSSSSSPTSGSPRPSHSSSTLERLETKLHLLRQEMLFSHYSSGEPLVRYLHKLGNRTSWDSQSSLEQVRVQTNHRAYQPAKALNSVLAETFSPSSLVGGPAQFSATLILILALSLTAMWHLRVM